MKNSDDGTFLIDDKVQESSANDSEGDDEPVGSQIGLGQSAAELRKRTRDNSGVDKSVGEASSKQKMKRSIVYDSDDE
jgi:hypothetical protein